MPDVRLVQSSVFPNHPAYAVECDWSLLDDGTLDDTQALATAMIVALGTDALAGPDDVLPYPDSSDRGGWWGNLDAAEIWDAWDIGSKLWLLKRAKITPSQALEGATVERVRQYIMDAVQPFIDRRIGSKMEVFAERVRRDQINALVRLYRGPSLEIELRYQVLWSEIIAQEPLAEYYTGGPPYG
jgi:phage gp46-like protein